MDRFNRTVCRRFVRDLHLHDLHDEQGVARLDGVTGFDQDFPHVPGRLQAYFVGHAPSPCCLFDVRFVTQRFDVGRGLLRLLDGYRFEIQYVPRLRLSQLPETTLRHGVRIDEPAHARPVAHQDDGGLTGQVDRAQRITLVDDVRGLLAVLR